MPWRDAQIVLPSQEDEQPEVEAQANQQNTSKLGSALTGFGQGISLGFGDEAASALRATVVRPFSDRTWRELYDEQLGIERGNIATARQEDPGLMLAGEVAGGVTAGLGAASRGATMMGGARSVSGAAGRGAAEGAIYGGLYGAGTGDDMGERITGAATGAALGAGSGAILGGAAGAISKRMAPQAPELEVLRGQAQQAYKAAEQAGVTIRPDSFQKFGTTLTQKLAKEGLDPTLHPRATAALNRISKHEGSVTLQEAENLRRVVKNAAVSNDSSERRIAHIMAENMDDYIEGLGFNDISAGNVGRAVESLKTARGLWARMSKGETIDTLMERAGNRAGQFSGSGYENAIRTEFRQLIQSPRRLRQFNKAEQEALKRVARGEPFDNALRYLGKAAPTSIVSGALGAGLGYAAAGPVGGLAVPLAGGIARHGATRATINRAATASDMVRRGSAAPALGAGFAPAGVAGMQPLIQNEEQ